MRWKTLVGAVSIAVFSGAAVAETIQVRVGHQSQVTNTVSGGIVIERLRLFEKHLPTDGKYEDTEIIVQYADFDSGPPITNRMIAGQLEFGVMGDYPLIVNGATFQNTGRAESLFIAMTGYNARGTGNGIVVPVDHPAQSLADLAGLQLSTPFGSAAWGMTLDALSQEGILDEVQLRDQSPPVGVANIRTGNIDAHSDFTPWSEVMEYRGFGRKVFDGSEVGQPTFHGTVVRDDFAEEHPRLVEAYIAATMEAQDWIVEDPMRAATKLEEWTTIEKEVLYLYFSEGGITSVDPTLKPEWVDALKYHHATLQRERSVPDLDFERWVDDSFVRSVFEAQGKDYDAQLDKIVRSEPGASGFPPAEAWYENEGIVKYESIGEMLAAVEEAEAAGSEVNATYVYDHGTGLKLFGHVASYVETDDGYVAFMRARDAAQFASENGGNEVELAALR